MKSNQPADGVAAVYGHRVRIRACGLCWRHGQLLLVNHAGLAEGDFWAPPGGGLEFGESVEERLRKEFLEETGLRVEPGRFLFGCEFIRSPLHAVELYFEVSATGGELHKGDDPELPIIHDVKFMSPSDIMDIPASARHGIFALVRTPAALSSLNGFFRI